jgi:phage-related protein
MWDPAAVSRLEIMKFIWSFCQSVLNVIIELTSFVSSTKKGPMSGLSQILSGGR